MVHFTFRPFAQLVTGCLAAVAVSGSASAEELAPPASWFDRVVQRLETTWHEGQPELYLPLYTYHLPYAYSREKINSYDVIPLGLGVGKGDYDRDGDWHGLYAMGFHDSHYKPAYIGGYGYKTFWHLSEELKVGLGYTAFLATRADIGSYTPFPGILPIASLEYQKFSVDTAYVPGGHGYGNILFFWGKMRF